MHKELALLIAVGLAAAACQSLSPDHEQRAANQSALRGGLRAPYASSEAKQHRRGHQHRGHQPREFRACQESIETKLQIIHSSDNESSFQDPNTLEPKILHYGAVVRGLQSLARSECIPSLHLTAGDHTIPGPFYQASAEVEGLGDPGLARG